MAPPKLSNAMTGVPGFSKEEIDQFLVVSNCPTIGNCLQEGSEILIEISPLYFSTWDYCKRD
ncbi:MAG: hypothetical protein AUF79_08660 [Crenarchaeota archaeon 13_1_20CM_2_51_8]|nr:MAG: hypothetical protein AUF79_08660 [Crenarchaeota archaeon 13_1_20CM_2_51_8]